MKVLCSIENNMFEKNDVIVYYITLCRKLFFPLSFILDAVSSVNLKVLNSIKR